MADKIEVTGLKELQARFMSLAATIGGKKAQKPVAAALRKTAVIVQKAAIQNLESGGHVLSGTLKNNIIVYKQRSRDDSLITYGVSIRSKAKKYKDNKRNQRTGRVGGTYKDYGPLFYARFLEFGTSHQPKTPFLAPAFETNKAQLPEVFRDDLAKRLDKIVL